MIPFYYGSGSGSGTVINYGSDSGSDFLARYGSSSGSSYASQKVTVPTVPVPVPVPQRCSELRYKDQVPEHRLPYLPYPLYCHTSVPFSFL